MVRYIFWMDAVYEVYVNRESLSFNLVSNPTPEQVALASRK